MCINIKYMLEQYPNLSAKFPENTGSILTDLSRLVAHLDRVIECNEQTVSQLQALYAKTLQGVLGAFETMVTGATGDEKIPLSILLYELECNWYRAVTERIASDSEKSIQEVRQQFKGLDDYAQLERSSLIKLHQECEAVHSALQSLFDKVGPSTMQRLPRSVNHIAIGKIADHFDEREKDESGGTSMSVDLSIGRTLLFDTLVSERRGFLTKAVVANVLKQFGKNMALQASEGLVDPHAALSGTQAMLFGLHQLYKEYGDPLDASTAFVATR